MKNRFIPRLIGLLVCTVLLQCFGGCTMHREPEKAGLVIYMPGSSTVSQDGLALINERLDQYVYEKLGVHVQLELPDNYSQAAKLALTGGRQVDIAYCVTLSDMRDLQKSGLLLPMDDLLEEHGQGILNTMDSMFYDFARQDGAVYALPTNREKHQIVGFEYNRALAEQYGLDLSAVHRAEDLTQVFAELKQKAPDITPTAVVPQFIRFNNTDNLEDGYAVLNGEANTRVVNLYETQEFQSFANLLYQWNSKGYLVDFKNQAGTILYYLRSGTVFGAITVGKVGFEAQESNLSGMDIGFQSLGETYCPTDAQERAWYVIPATSADPEKAMELLTLLYTDPEIANLILYGVEGTHYTYVDRENQVIRLNTSKGAPAYSGPLGYAYCNQYIAAIPEGYDPDIWEQTEQVNMTAVRSPAWGFRFDSTPVADQVFRCDQVRDRYLGTIYAGLCDPAEILPEFLTELQKAGIDAVIAEKQRQLDLYLQGE